MWQLALGQIGNTAANGGISFLPETEALVARFTTPPTYARKVLINTTIGSLISGGVWSKLDALYVIAAEDAQAARRNWLADQYNATAISSPTFTTDRGYAGNGTTSYLTTGFNPVTAGGNYSQNSAVLFLADLTSRAANANVELGISNGGITQQSILATRNTGDIFVGKVNDVTTGTVTSTNSQGRFTASRQSSSEKSLYINGSLVSSPSVSSITVPSFGFFVCCINFGGSPLAFSTDQIAAVALGGGLSSGEVSTLDSAIANYLTAVGA